MGRSIARAAASIHAVVSAAQGAARARGAIATSANKKPSDASRTGIEGEGRPGITATYTTWLSGAGRARAVFHKAREEIDDLPPLPLAVAVARAAPPRRARAHRR